MILADFRKAMRCNILPGSPALADRVADLLKEKVDVVRDDRRWGLDHGTWSVLCHVFRMPTFRHSALLNENEPAEYHYELAKSWHRCVMRTC